MSLPDVQLENYCLPSGSIIQLKIIHDPIRDKTMVCCDLCETLVQKTPGGAMTYFLAHRDSGACRKAAKTKKNEENRRAVRQARESIQVPNQTEATAPVSLQPLSSVCMQNTPSTSTASTSPPSVVSSSFGTSLSVCMIDDAGRSHIPSGNEDTAESLPTPLPEIRPPSPPLHLDDPRECPGIFDQPSQVGINPCGFCGLDGCMIQLTVKGQNNEILEL